MPVGSFPWALSQVYLGNLVRRNGWSEFNKYIKYFQSQRGYCSDDIPPHIGISNKGRIEYWYPTQEDMTTCDWKLVTPEFNRLQSNNFDLKCPFNPTQYTFDNDKITVPVGSLPWALSQVYLGNPVSRNSWDSQYIRLSLDSRDNMNSLSFQIEIINKNEIKSWKPTQDDMMTCDWKLKYTCPKNTPKNTTLCFSAYMRNIGLNIGSNEVTPNNGDFNYSGFNDGAISDFSQPFDLKVPPFGKLINLRSDSYIKNTSFFYQLSLSNNTQPDIVNGLYIGLQFWVDWGFSSNELFRLKNLSIIVDGKSYDLGSSILNLQYPNTEIYLFSYYTPENLCKYLHSINKEIKSFSLIWSDK